jgi:hypothetical protein
MPANRNDRPPPPPATGMLTVVWQVDPASTGIWEGDWIRSLLAGLRYTQVVDTRHQVAVHQALVIDQRIKAGSLSYYSNYYRTGARFALLHLSDEGFADDCSVYGYCEQVFRNYWSPDLAQRGDVGFLPLGYKSGFRIDAVHKSARERSYLWSFMGEQNRPTRPQMLDALEILEPSYVHVSDAFGEGNYLPLAEYQAILEDSIFAACPSGFRSLDSFRIYEALECGCIPVVERRPGPDYFTELFGGNHPLLEAPDWIEARRRMQTLLADPAALEARRRACAAWWREYRVRLTRDVAGKLRAALALA